MKPFLLKKKIKYTNSSLDHTRCLSITDSWWISVSCKQCQKKQFMTFAKYEIFYFRCVANDRYWSYIVWQQFTSGWKRKFIVMIILATQTIIFILKRVSLSICQDKKRILKEIEIDKWLMTSVYSIETASTSFCNVFFFKW